MRRDEEMTYPPGRPPSTDIEWNDTALSTAPEFRRKLRELARRRRQNRHDALLVRGITAPDVTKGG